MNEASLRKTPSFLEFFLCLSRACLGKTRVVVCTWVWPVPIPTEGICIDVLRVAYPDAHARGLRLETVDVDVLTIGNFEVRDSTGVLEVQLVEVQVTAAIDQQVTIARLRV